MDACMGVEAGRSAPEEKTWWRIIGREVPFRGISSVGEGTEAARGAGRPKGWVIIGSGKVAGA